MKGNLVQFYLNKKENWATKNGFKFSTSKTTGMYFCNQIQLHPDSGLALYNSPIMIVKETKFLCLVCDSKHAVSASYQNA